MEVIVSTIEYRVIGKTMMPELVTFVVRSSSFPAGMEPKPKRREPVERVEGTVVAQSEKNDVSLAATLASLRIGDYRLVESYCEMRETAPGKKWSKMFYVLTYTFAREADEDCGSIMECLEMLTGALWQVRVYQNLLFRNGLIVDGEFTLSINCHRRQPLYEESGASVFVWNADRTEKVPLAAGSELRIDGDHVSISTIYPDVEEEEDFLPPSVITW